MTKVTDAELLVLPQFEGLEAGMAKETYVVHFDGVPGGVVYEVFAEDWGDAEGLAMYSADDSMRCDSLKITKAETGEVKEYARNKSGIWFRRV
jgi:hypothetical protein